MSRRNKGKSGVRGPNSALTEFLREEGITDAFRRRRERQNEPNNGPDLREVSEEVQETQIVSEEVDPEQAGLESDTERQMRVAARKKRRALRSSDGFPSDSDGDDNDDNDYDSDYDEDLGKGNNRFKNFGEYDECVECGDSFQLNVYSRYLSDKKGYLCEKCKEVLKNREKQAQRNQLNARRKRKKWAKALLDRTVVSIPRLQDICINKITENIGEVDAVGDIGQVNVNKITKILSKNRSLNDSTVLLFLLPGLKELEFWDCSKVDSDSFHKIASFCSDIESLTLYMCGQLHNDNLMYFASNLKHLKTLALDGPFLISDTTWLKFFEEVGPRLTSLEVRNTHRFSNDSFISFLTNCGPTATLIKLSRLDGLDSASAYDLLTQYVRPTLKTLEISYPHNEELINDDFMIHLLAVAGESLEVLILDGCSHLTDNFLIEGVAKFCPNLTRLSIQRLDQLTNEEFAKAFEEYSLINTAGLVDVNLQHCTGLGDQALHALFEYTASSLVHLCVNGLYRVTKDFIFQIFTDDNLQYKKDIKKRHDLESDETKRPKFFKQIDFPLLTSLDIGFIREVDDEVLNLISKKCSKLMITEVFGNNRCTSSAQFAKGLLVIGRQSDTV